MKTRRSFLAALTAVALVGTLGLVGCAKQQAAAPEKAQESAKAKVELTVFAANSLEKALPEVQALYTKKTGVTFKDTQFKGSGDLVEQLKANSKSADVLITASTGTMEKALKNQSVDSSTKKDMFKNDLVVATSEKGSLKLASIADLGKADVQSFALGEPNAVPAGKYAVQALENAKLCTTKTSDDKKTITVTWADSVKSKVNAGADKVGTVAQYVASGQAQFGFCYSSDIYRYKGVKVALTVPKDMHKPIVYPGAVCASTAHKAEAAAFLKFCLEDKEAQKVFSKYGFEIVA